MNFKRITVVGILCAIAVATLGLPPSASATVLCKTATNPCTGGTYGKGTTIEASLKSGTKSVLHPPFGDIECSEASIKGEVTNAGGEGTKVTGTISALGFGGCSATVSVLKEGTFTIEAAGGGNGTLKLEGLETTTESFGFHCIYSVPGSMSLKGGEPASIAGPSSLKLTGGRSGTFCGELGTNWTWTVEYAVTAPKPLYVAERAATVLCKSSSNPCTGGTYGKGTAIEASLKSGTKSILHPPIGDISCEEASIKGEVTNPGGEEADVSGSVSSLGFGKCNAKVQVLKNGSFTLESAGEGNGRLKLEGLETTVEFNGFHCIFVGTVSIQLQGGEMASIGSTATVPRAGGRSGAFCGSSAQWTVEYTVTGPEPLYVEEPSISTVLCKTATSPCTVGTYGKGQAIEASLQSATKSVLHAVFGDIECSEASIKGEVTNAGGEGSKVTGSISSFGFGSCNATVSVLKKGTFTISSPSAGNGTLKIEGLETTIEFVGFHCIFSGSVTASLKGGEMASLSITKSSLAPTGGRSWSSGFCGEADPSWTAEYTVTAPEPLYVEES